MSTAFPPLSIAPAGEFVAGGRGVDPANPASNGGLSSKPASRAHEGECWSCGRPHHCHDMPDCEGCEVVEVEPDLVRDGWDVAAARAERS